MKICFYPYKLELNLYVDLMKHAAKLKNYDTYKFREVLKDRKLFKEVQIYHLNWYESINGKNGIIALAQYLIKVTALIYLKLNGKKIIWTMHNKTQHSKKYSTLTVLLMKSLCKISSKIVIHSYESEKILNAISKEKYIKDKVIYIPHPNYISCYQNRCTDMRNDFSIGKKELVFLFVGQVSPYKNIEILIQTFNELKLNNAKLIIAGKSNSDDYARKLEILACNNRNIITYFHYVREDEMDVLLNTCDIVVLPYDLRSSLNSGAVFLAFSNGKTVICPENGTILDLKNENICFSYYYENEKEHYSKLKDTLRKSYELFNEDANEINEIGRKAFKYVDENNNINIVSEKLNILYEGVIRN